MKLSVLTVLLGGQPLDEVLGYLGKLGITTVELGTGGYPGTKHADPARLLADKGELAAFKETLRKHGVTIGAFSCHGNAIHPNPEIAKSFQTDFDNTLKLAEEMGVDRVVTFSGCPGGSPADKTPNWVTCPWPDDYTKILKYQWEDVLIPYWQKTAAQAERHGVTKIALELHPGFMVYNPESMLKLRAAVGKTVGANLDPSHLFWQGCDIPTVIRKLGDAILYFHAKDTRVDPMNTAAGGVLDLKHYGDELNRAWVFRTVGYGHDYQVWKDIVSNLRMVGYDDVISIEHEDGLLSPKEGLEKAVSFLKEVIPFEETGEMFWA